MRPATWARVSGEISGLITIDFDGEAGAATMRRLGLDPHRQTPSGGYHVDVTWPGRTVPTLNAKSSKALGDRWPGMDIRGDGGYVIIAGHTAKGPYVWLRELDPDPPSVLQSDLWRFLWTEEPRPATPSRPRPSLPAGPCAATLLNRALSCARNGRNNAGFWLAIQLRDNGYTPGQAESVLEEYAARVPPMNQHGDREPYTIAEVRATVRSAYSRPPRQPWGYQA